MPVRLRCRPTSLSLRRCGQPNEPRGTNHENSLHERITVKRETIQVSTKRGPGRAFQRGRRYCLYSHVGILAGSRIQISYHCFQQVLIFGK